MIGRIAFAAIIFTMLAVIMLRTGLYYVVLRALNLGERRCGWCQKFLGFKRGLHGNTSHGMCTACSTRWHADLDKQESVKLDEQRRARRRQTPLRKTLRRRTGGWSGAIASCGRVS